MNNKVLEKVDEIIEYIENTPNYKKYLSIKDVMKNDEEINLLLDEIRFFQKKIVNNQSLKEEYDRKILENNKLLLKNPIYLEYMNTIDEINNTLNIIENELNNYFYNKLN